MTSPSTGPFRLGAARRAGLTPNQLRGPGFRRLGQGLYAPAATQLSLAHLAAAALLTSPADAVITGVTALHLRGVEVGDPLPVRAVTATSGQTRRANVRLTRARSLPPHRHRVARPANAWLAACTEFDLVEAVTAADWLIRRRWATRDQLVAAAGDHSGRGARLARRAAALSADRVDSPRETRLRLALVLAGLPTPVCNPTLGGDSFAIGRVDLLIEAFGVILEYDGDQHRTDRTQWNLDLDRDDAFADLGFATIRVTSARMRRPRQLVGRVFDQLVQRGYDGPTPDFSPEWCALFERRV